MKILLKDKGNLLFDVFDLDFKGGNYNICVVELFKNDKFWLNKIQIQPDCKGKEYGAAIIKYLKENYKPFRISLSSKNFHYHRSFSGDSRCLTSEGLHLVKKCFQNGILKTEYFEFPDPDILLEYRIDNFLDNSNDKG